jgi:serine/threonine-protein kinase
MIGKTLSHYRILEQIGAGGMGEVYRAHDERLHRDVAVKVLPAGALADETARKRFRNEALALSKLNHPHIATVFDFDTWDGVDFIAMELVEGQSLEEKLQAGALPEEEIVEIGRQIADALEEAHEQGVVHRDLKPGNISLTAKGRVKVLDFGLARMLQPVSELASTEALTEKHAVVGTLPYMSPDELRGERSDHRSDIYSFGVVLYEMATGGLPFEEEVFTLLTVAILDRAPESPAVRNRKISPGLEAIILKALEKSPGHRYQSAREMREDLERLLSPMSLVPPRPRRSSRAWIWVAGSLAVVAAVAVVLLSWDRSPEIDSVAVLPLENLSGDPEQDYFAAGMTEALITDLAKIGALQVISRSSTQRFKGTDRPLPEIARLLKVDAVIVGSVLRSDDRVRITARLVHAETDRHLWAESYERDLRDVLAIQAEVAREIAGEIQLTLTPEEEARLTRERPVDPAAHAAYLRGRYHWNRRTREDLELGLRHFREAVAKDPHYAAAHAGLADSYNMLSETEYGEIPAREAQAEARHAAEKAVELDGNLAEGHAALGYVLLQQGDEAGAERELERAIALNPSYVTARHYYSVVLCLRGDLDRAIDEVRRALQLDPLSGVVNLNLGRYLYWARRYDDAVAQLRRTLELDPESVNAHFWLGYAYLQKSMPEQAVAAHTKVEDLYPDALDYTYGAVGRKEEARQILSQVEGRETPGPAFAISIVYVGLGENDLALDWLEKSFEREEIGGALHARYDPVFDPLRGEARFQELLRRIKSGD